MGVSIERGATFLGVPLIKVRNVLKAWRYVHRDDLWRASELKTVDLDPRTVMVLLEELRDREILGLEEKEFGPPEYGLTEAGLALAGAAARKRTPKALAEPILDRFLEACAAVNARDDLPFEIRRVWLFGSMIDSAKLDVGDIDLVVEKGLTARYSDHSSAHDRFRQLAKEMGAPPQTGIMSIFGGRSFVERQLLHGGRRHPLLSMNDEDELRDMACPCRLVFDGERGGRVADPVLHRHPASNGRSNRIGDRRRMPDLAEGRQALRPISARLLTCRRVGYRTMKALGRWPEDDFGYRLADRHVSYMAFMADGIPPPRHDANALSKRVRLENCDGRHRTSLMLIEMEQIDPGDWRSGYSRRPVVAAVIERSIREDGPRVSYQLDFAEADHLGRSIEYGHMLAFEWWAHVIATADVERIVRREQELQLELDVAAEISFSADRSIAGLLAQVRGGTGRCLAEETRTRMASQRREGFRGKDFFRDRCAVHPSMAFRGAV